MITIDVDEYCHTCPDFEPSKIMLPYWADNVIINADTKVICKHKDRCQNLRAYLEKKIREEKETIPCI